MPVWNASAIDYSKGVVFMPDGTIKAKKIGCLVMTLEEAEKCLENRRRNGDLKPEVLEASHKRFLEEIRKVKDDTNHRDIV